MATEREKRIKEKVEATLLQLGAERYRANPFLWTRMRLRLREADRPALGWWKPVLAAALLSLNLFVLINRWPANSAVSQNGSQAIAEQYYWMDDNWYYLYTEKEIRDDLPQ